MNPGSLGCRLSAVITQYITTRQCTRLRKGFPIGGRVRAEMAPEKELQVPEPGSKFLITMLYCLTKYFNPLNHI